MAARNTENPDTRSIGRREVLKAGAAMVGAGALSLAASPAWAAAADAAPTGGASAGGAAGGAHTLVGAIRWDAWVGSEWAVGSTINRTLSPEKYRYRLPFYATTWPADIVEDGFDAETPGSQPANWTVDVTGAASVAVVDLADRPGRGVRLHSESAGTAGATLPFPAQGRAATATWAWKEHAVDGESRATVTSGSTAVAEVAVQGAVGARELVYRTTGGTWKSVVGVAGDTWHSIKVVADPAPPQGASPWVDIFVDGLRLVNHVPFLSAARTLDGLSFVTASSGPAELYLDDVGVDHTESVNSDATSAAVMDREIRYANAAGIDYWAFVYYPQNPLSLGRQLYLERVRTNDVNWCAILDSNFTGNFAAHLPQLVQDFAGVNYQTVLDGRPLVYFLGTATTANVAALRSAAALAGVPDPYVVAMAWTAASAASVKTQVGADAVSRYATGEANGSPYSQLSTQEAGLWQDYANAAGTVVPTVSTGWDERPRYDYPVSWEPNFAPFKDQWTQQAEPSEIAAHLESAIRWSAQNPQSVPAATVLIYAWNEFDEGGWICPTLTELRDYGRPLRLLAIGGVDRGRRQS